MKETEKKISEKVINLEELSKRSHSEVGEMLDIFKKDVHQESALNIYKHFHYILRSFVRSISKLFKIQSKFLG